MSQHARKLVLVVAVLALSVPFLRAWSTQPASRYLYTVALVDDHSIRLDPYATSLGLDPVVPVPGSLVPQVANPLRLSATPPSYRTPPPSLPGGGVFCVNSELAISMPAALRALGLSGNSPPKSR